MHTNPEVLALLALGEHVADPADTEHLADCAVCREEVASLARLIDQGRRAPDGETLDTPSESVWMAIQAELGFIPVSSSWPDAVPAVTPTDPDNRPASRSGHDAAPSTSGPQPTGEQTTPPAGAIPGTAAPSTTTPSTTTPGTTPVQSGARRPGRRALSLVLAAAVALVAGIGIGVGITRAGQPQETVVGRATLTGQANWADASGSARLVQDAGGNLVLYVDLKTTQPPPGDQQVWLVNPTTDARRAVGYLNGAGQGFWTLPPGTDIGTSPVIDVSDEPSDDTSLGHSGDTIARGELQR